jgi:hypothetical protein
VNVTIAGHQNLDYPGDQGAGVKFPLVGNG